MVHDQRNVGMLGTAEQIDAAQADRAVLAGIAHEILLAKRASVQDQCEGFEIRLRADRGKQALDLDRLGDMAGDHAQMLDVAVVAGLEDDGAVDLRGCRTRAFADLDDCCLDARARQHDRTMEDRALVFARSQGEDGDRLGELRARRDLDEHAVAHQGGVEHQPGIGVGHSGARQDARDVLTTGDERIGQAVNGQPLGQAFQRREFGHEDAIDQDETHAVERQRGQPRTHRVADKRALGQRPGLAQQRAQIGIAPGFQPPMRQALRLEAGKGVLTQLAHRQGARQFGLGGGELGAERLFGSRLQRGYDGHHAAST